jgi:uncharacterized membrane protein
MWVWWIAIAAIVGWVVWLAVRRSRKYDPAEAEELLELLRRRYASGAISETEYRERLEVLQTRLP